MSSAYTNFVIKMNNREDANRVAAIMKEITSRRTPDYPTENDKFIEGIVIDGKEVRLEDNFSLTSNSFRELIPQIMTDIAGHSFVSIKMEAWYTSCNCGYEAEYLGRISKSGEFTMSFNEHD